MLNNIKRLLDNKERRKFSVLVTQMVLVALLEFLGIALVLPFIRYAGGQLSAERLPDFIAPYITRFGDNQTLIYVGVTIFFLIVISTLLKIYLGWREQKFVWDLSLRLSLKQHKNILSKDYVFFIEKNSAEIITNLIVETSTVVRGVLLPFAQIISNSIIAMLFLGLITYLEPKISLILIGGSVIVGVTIIYLLKNTLSNLGQKRLLLERSRYLQLKESILGIKTVKTNAKEMFFQSKFAEVSEKYTNIKPIVNTLNSIPRKAMDIFLFGGVVLLVTIIVYRGGEVTTLLPKLTFYVLVGFKLLPTFQNIINSIITIRFSYPSIKAVFEGLDESTRGSLRRSDKRLLFNQNVELVDCSFSHVENENVLDNVSIKIEKGQRIGIVGYSGSGKTTLVEVISGLLFPSQGKLLLDGNEINDKNLADYLNIIAFIPQSVFFFDDTILRNITFEDDLQNVDLDHLASVLKLLSLNEFIDELPHGLQSRVGEFGVKMSGGQRQRIGFARAMYRKPEILILDESTSAMDYITEQNLLSSVKQELTDLTLIKVAHRLKSVKDCDIIYFVEQGRITAKGTFDEIVKDNSLFKDMVLAGRL